MNQMKGFLNKLKGPVAVAVLFGITPFIVNNCFYSGFFYIIFS